MARAIWRGTLRFGLVNIAVELEPIDAPERLDLNLLDRRDMARIGYQKINKSTHKPVPDNEIVRGFPVSRNRHVVLSDEEIAAANPKATHSVEVFGFVPVGTVGRIYYAKPYYIVPRPGNEKAYVLLRDVLARSGQIALAEVVIHTRQYVAAVYPSDDLLVAHMLRYHDEMRPATVIDRDALRDAERGIRPAERQMAGRLIEAMETTWKPEEHRDTFRDDLLRLVHARARKGGGRATRQPPRHPAGKGDAKVLDLMAALRASVTDRSHSAASRRKRSGHPHRRSA